MKRKLVTLGIAFLLCIGMVGAGFASWVVTNNVTETVDGQISVESVVDARLELDVDFAANEKVVFGGNDATQTWLLYKGDEQDLDIKVTLTLTNYADLLALQSAADKEIDDIEIKVSLAETLTEGTGALGDNQYIKAAVDAKYIELPTLEQTLKLSDFASEGNKKEVTFTFAWGTAFGGVNPLEYYNNKAADAKVSEGATKTYAEEALEVLGTLEQMNSVGFTVTVTGKVTMPTA